MSNDTSFTLSEPEDDGGTSASHAGGHMSTFDIPVPVNGVSDVVVVSSAMVQSAVSEGIRRGMREGSAPLMKKIQSLEKTINSQTVILANATRELKEIRQKLDKGVQPLKKILTKAGVVRVRNLAWLNPALIANSPRESELLKSLMEELKEAGDLLKLDAKTEDDVIKGFHYERNQLKSQIKSRVKLDLRLELEQAYLLPATTNYLRTHLVEASEEVTIVAFQLGYTMARYLNSKVNMVGDSALKQQKEAIKDVWDVVSKRILVDPSGVEQLKDKIRASLGRGYQAIDK